MVGWDRDGADRCNMNLWLDMFGTLDSVCCLDRGELCPTPWHWHRACNWEQCDGTRALRVLVLAIGLLLFCCCFMGRGVQDVPTCDALLTDIVAEAESIMTDRLPSMIVREVV